MNDKIKPIHDGISFEKYLIEVFTENGELFSKKLCENKLSIETERSISFNLKDSFGNNHILEITLKDGDNR